MIGAIVGDVVGSYFEHSPTKCTDFELFSDNSYFTDDTVLTVAVADWILNGGDLRTYFLGGDSDTMACIAGAIAEPFFGGVPDDTDAHTGCAVD